MCLISNKHKSICFLPEKTGSTTVSEILCRYFDFKKYKKRHETNFPCECGDYFLFGTVRNPYKREISRYAFYKVGQRAHLPKKFLNTIKNKNLNFEDWIKIIDSSMSLTDYYNNIKLNHFIRLENLKEDFEKLPFYEKLPDSIWRLCRNNRKDKETIAFTEESKNIFLEKFINDFYNFNYNVNF